MVDQDLLAGLGVLLAQNLDLALQLLYVRFELQELELLGRVLGGDELLDLLLFELDSRGQLLVQPGSQFLYCFFHFRFGLVQPGVGDFFQQRMQPVSFSEQLRVLTFFLH